jgi:hypothetical protein
MPRSRIWLVADAIFILGNVVGGIAAAGQGEFGHAGVHLILVLIGAAVAWVIAPKGSPTPVAESSNEFNDGLTRLQQSVDAVALEVERIGEGQRYVTQLLNDDATVNSVSGSPPQPTRRL